METISNKTPEQKSETSKKLSDVHNNKTQAEKDEIKRRELETRANKSDAEKLATSKKRSESLVAAHAKRTTEQKQETRNLIFIMIKHQKKN